MPVSIALAQTGEYDPDVKRLLFRGVSLPPPGNTLVLILMVNGSYAGVDAGPLAGQYDGSWAFLGVNSLPVTLTTTDILVGGVLETWPTAPPSYDVTIDQGVKLETMTVTALNRVTRRITVTRSAPQTHTPGRTIRGETTLVDGGQTPPLLYIPGDPTSAPARTGSWWAHRIAGTTDDTSFAQWESRYWLSGPNLPAGHPPWATLCVLARTIDGTEYDIGLIHPVTADLEVSILGAAPSPFLFQPRGELMAFTQTVEILPLPEASGDIAPPADHVPTVPPDPRWPPFIWHYPLTTWTPRLVSSAGMNGEDLWLPILLSSKSSSGPDNVIYGWDDVTGIGVEDVPNFLLDENWFSTGTYAVRRQVATAPFTVTHNPNPIIYDLLKVGGTPSPANIPSAGLGAARVPCAGQHPWWELGAFKEGDLVLSPSNSVTPSTPADQPLHTGDIMLLVAQSDGVAAPSDPEGWTPIPAISGPNVHGHQPVTVTTFLNSSVLAGASTIEVAMAGVSDFGPAPVTLVIEGGSPPTSPAETLTASSYTLAGEPPAFATMNVGAVGSPHFGGSVVTLTNPGLLAYDQYVAAWWKIAEGPPPDGFGVPSEAVESGPAITFPDAIRTSARMYGMVADQTDPFSPVSAGVPGVTRVDIPAPAARFGGPDVIPEDGISLRAHLAMAVGSRAIGSGEDMVHDIRKNSNGPTFMMLPVANPFPASYEWNAVDPAGVAVALCLPFRGFRERPEYPLVDGHFAPNYDNRGVLPPCAGGGRRASGDYRTGFGLSHIVADVPTTRVVFSRVGMWGNTSYLRAWCWASEAAVDVEGYIVEENGTENLWFATLAGDLDFYADPPDLGLIPREHPFSIRIIVRGPTGMEGYYGFLAWSEEECQPPTVASYGLQAAFRYHHKDLHMPSTQQASIVG